MTDETEFLAERFEEHRPHLRAVAYRMLGTLSEAEDAVQESWLRLDRADASGVRNLGGWLTTVVGRVCLDMLRSRTARHEAPLEPAEARVHVPDPVVERADTADPEQQALVADSVGLALLVVLESLAPAERLAFVLHDLFGVPFDEIAPVVGRTPAATRQLASRARRRVQGSPAPDADPVRQREVVDAFLAAAREGDFEGLLRVLDPDVVLRADHGTGGPVPSAVVRGAQAVARGAITFRDPAAVHRPALVNGAVGVVAYRDGHPASVIAFTVVGGRVLEVDILADPERLARIDLSAVEG
ncbi:sigma-70 family RNA polymerase sigma factor [Streptomyces sp. NPDC001941]|uniref:sigma-70 family RNA polymerase sigma factor n=1 Tax=Streptomyces sp. NPDC001941 TaxID=3154659 RepID=UPI003325E060